MVSLEDSHSGSNHFPLTRNFYSPSPTKLHRNTGRSMQTIRSNFYREDQSCCSLSPYVSENLTDSVMDMRLGELALRTANNSDKSTAEEFIQLSQAFSDFSTSSSDNSGELQRLARLPSSENAPRWESEPEPCEGFLQRESFSIESISPEDLQPMVKICVDSLQSPSIAVKQSAATKLRLLAKNRADNRALIGESGAVLALIPLLRCSEPWTQEHAVTALLNLSLHESNKAIITSAGAIKSLVYVLKTGTETSKQNAACALLSLALMEENKSSIGVLKFRDELSVLSL